MSAWRGTEGAFPAHAAASHKTNVSFWDAEEGKQEWGVRVVQTGTSTPWGVLWWGCLFYSHAHPMDNFATWSVFAPRCWRRCCCSAVGTRHGESCEEHIHNKVSLMLASNASAAWNLSTVGYFFLWVIAFLMWILYLLSTWIHWTLLTSIQSFYIS